MNTVGQFDQNTEFFHFLFSNLFLHDKTKLMVNLTHLIIQKVLIIWWIWKQGVSNFPMLKKCRWLTGHYAISVYLTDIVQLEVPANQVFFYYY